MDFQLQRTGDEDRICLAGRLTFAQHESFREVVTSLDGLGRAVVLDLSGVEFVDSAGLGMLLVARDHVAGRGGRVTLRNANDQVGRMLALARFGDFFLIDR